MRRRDPRASVGQDRLECPHCHAVGDRVLDSRPSADRRLIRRRRQCQTCGARYSTIERITTSRADKSSHHNA